MSAPKKGRRPDVVPPPPRRAAIAALTPGITEADLADLARAAGRELVEGATPHPVLARETTEALRRYALFHRMDHAAAGAGEVTRWAVALQRWATEGLVLLGGTLDADTKAEGFPLPHSAAAGHLADAWPACDPACDVAFHLEYLLHRATGHRLFPEERGERPDEHGLVHCSAAALELFQFLAASLEQRALVASLEQRAASMPRETRPTEYARHELVRTLAGLYEKLHGHPAEVVRPVVRDKSATKRDQLPEGAALKWFRGLFALAAARANDPVVSGLAEWSRKTDALAEVLRKISGKRR